MRNFTKVSVIFVLSVVYACGVAPTQEQSDTPIEGEPVVGTVAPDFALNTLDSNVVQLSAMRGKPVLLNFWATWCAPCVAEMPDLEKLQQEMGEQVHIVGVNLRETRGRVREFVQASHFSWIFVLDSTGEVGAKYQVSAIPTSVMVDANGVIANRQVGALNYDGLRQLVQTGIEN